MQKTFKKFGGTLMILIAITVNIASTATALADDPVTPATPDTKAQIKELLPNWSYENKKTNESKINLVSSIDKNTQGTWADILGNVIKFVLGITGALALVSFTYSGILMVTARGAEDQIKKGKEMIFMSILALAIIAISYAIVLGISQLKF